MYAGTAHITAYAQKLWFVGNRVVRKRKKRRGDELISFARGVSTVATADCSNATGASAAHFIRGCTQTPYRLCSAISLRMCSNAARGLGVSIAAAIDCSNATEASTAILLRQSSNAAGLRGG